MSARNQSEDNKMTELLNRVQKSIAVVFFFFFLTVILSAVLLLLGVFIIIMLLICCDIMLNCYVRFFKVTSICL